MSFKFAEHFGSLLSNNKYERLKFIMLTSAFFLVIAAYTMVRELKDSIFMSIVGKEYVPWAKMLSMVVLIPAVLFYSMLVDRLRRYQLLYFCSVVYGIIGLLSAYLIGDALIGLKNTDSSPLRLFGWFFYFFIDGFAPFVVSVFWAFANSVNSPESAKNNYALMVSGSKIGGMLSAGFSWWLLTWRTSSGQRLYSDVLNHQILLVIFSILVLMIPFVIYLLMKVVPGTYLHGYEAVYQFEKQKAHDRPGIFSGLEMFFKWPYILGIFGMLFFYEVINTILSYQRLGVAESASSSVSDISYFLFQQAFAMHFIGFIISLVGTRMLLRTLGEEICLMLIPLLTGCLLLYFMFDYTPFSLLVAFVSLKSINYAFAQPVRESLYIPTVKNMKFKSKSWIDAFGAKLARTTGSSFNLFVGWIAPALYFSVHSIFFVLIIGLWLLTAFLLGKRYSKAVANNEIIGQEEEGSMA